MTYISGGASRTSCPMSDEISQIDKFGITNDLLVFRGRGCYWLADAERAAAQTFDAHWQLRQATDSGESVSTEHPLAKGK